MYFKDIALQIKNMGNGKQIRPVDWKDCDALGTLRLNSKVGKRDGSTPQQRVFGRTPKIPIRVGGNRNFCDSTYRKDSPLTQEHQVLAELSDPQGGLFIIKSTGSRHGVRMILFYGKLLMPIKIMAKIKRILNGKGVVSL